MNKWIVIIISIIIVLGLSVMGIKAYCHYLETNIAYTNPQIKYIKKAKTNSTIVLNSNTDIHVDGAGRFTLMPNGTLILDNPTQIQTTQTTSSTTISNLETTESGNSKPLIPTETHYNAIVGLNIGYNVLFNPNFPTSQIPQINLENWRIGVYTDLIGNRISVDYAHVNSYPDVLTLSTSIKIF